MFISPSLTGSFSSKRFSTSVVDESRVDPHDLGMNRSLGIDIYLPFPKGTAIQPYASEAIDYWKNADFWTPSQKNIFHEELRLFKGRTTEVAKLPVIEGRFPTVIFSHGFGAWVGLYSYLIEEIVSHGFSVIGVNHTYNAGISKVDNQSIYGKMNHKDLLQDNFAAREQQLWIDDQTYLLKLIFSNLKRQYSFVNEKKIFSIGHSFGGSTATHLTASNEKICGGINLDGAIFGHPSPSPKVPLFLLLGAESIKSFKKNDSLDNLVDNLSISHSQAVQFKEAYIDRIEELKKFKKVDVSVLEGIDHIGFTDFNFLSDSNLFSNAPIGVLKSGQMIKVIRREVLSFLKSLL